MARVTLTESRLANLGANAALRAFDRYCDRFAQITHRAPTRFEQRDWHGMQRDSVERLDLYRDVVDHLTAEVQELLGDRVEDKLVWVAIKAVYSGLIADRNDWDVAETFFNSLTRRIFTTVGVDQHIEFVATDYTKPPTKAGSQLTHRYERGPAAALVEQILTDFVRFQVRFQDIRRDAKLVALEIEQHLRSRGLGDVSAAEVVPQPFFRGKGAYLVGSLEAGGETLPMVLALRNPGDGLVVDAVLLDSRDASILFSFTRSYFHVDVDRPYDLVRFLATLMPRKRIAELYTSIGYHKHGKTELYRDLLGHIGATDERFDHARGIAGLVMVVFTMPGFDVVFKVLRDRFGAPKRMTPADVKAKYRHVFLHDRAGRLVDAQQFEHLEFDRSRFTDELLDELTTECRRAVRVEGEKVVVAHAYVERRVDPLNLYVREAEAEAAEAAVVDYGLAIKDLAKTNIFPGDMLLKNFGVTRHGRVVFYDYDELAEITELRFRDMPEAEFDDDVMSDEPWFGVGEHDVFPEELRAFLGLPGPLREAFERRHGDLFTPAFWTGIQERLRGGEIIEIFPYGASRRLQEA